MFETIYELSLNRNYVLHWGLREAVRELIQNAIDSDSPFEYSFNLEQDTDLYQLRLTSKYTVLPASTLLLGTTSKAEDDEAIGSFGEGYKIALLVLTRLNTPVTVLNGKVKWIPEFRFIKRFGQELLVIKEESIGHGNEGLSFIIGGLDAADVEAIKDSCLQMQSSIGEVKNTQYGQILLDKPGTLYVGGLYICKTELEYGYNINPIHIKLERDRQTVNSFDLKLLAKDMWFETEEYDLVAELMERNIPDLEYANYSTPELLKEACYKIFKKNHGAGAVIATSKKEMEELVAKKLEKVVYIGGGSYSSSIIASSGYQKETPKVVTQTVEEILTEWFESNKRYMSRYALVSFKLLLAQAKNWVRK